MPVIQSERGLADGDIQHQYLVQWRKTYYAHMDTQNKVGAASTTQKSPAKTKALKKTCIHQCVTVWHTEIADQQTHDPLMQHAVRS